MQTLTYGLKLPENGDKGSIWFPALEDNITQLDAHSHNGVNSAKLNSTALNKTTQSISAANWVAVGDGTGRYSQDVVLPGGITYDNIVISFKIDSVSKANIFLDMEKVTGSTYKVYINDNTLDLVAVYS